MARSGRVRYLVFTWVPESRLEEWNDWHSGVHMAHVLAAPQIRGARKLRVHESALPMDWQPQYVTIYELESLADFEAYRNGPGVALRAEYDARYGGVGRIARLVLVEGIPAAETWPMAVVTRAESPEDLRDARELFREYAGSLGFDLTFQDFARELAELPGDYGAPRGVILIARDADVPVGCVALRPLDADTCEMKRLYVRPGRRGSGLGRLLVTSILEEARARGYRRMRLDTVPGMDAALALYREAGFHEIPPYRVNPIPGALFLEREL